MSHNDHRPGIPVLWAVCGNPAAKPPYGQVVHLTKD